jgi:hypothetical protein
MPQLKYIDISAAKDEEEFNALIEQMAVVMYYLTVGKGRDDGDDYYYQYNAVDGFGWVIDAWRTPEEGYQNPYDGEQLALLYWNFWNLLERGFIVWDYGVKALPKSNLAEFTPSIANRSVYEKIKEQNKGHYENQKQAILSGSLLNVIWDRPARIKKI